MPAVILNVNGVNKKSTDINYEDLVWLHKNFYNRTGKYPTSIDSRSCNNLPQWKIVNKILKQNNKTINDFSLEIGRISHVRSSINNYDFYIQRLKEIYKKNNHITENFLINNSYGLPSPKWFVENCPDKEVRTWNDFMRWCGFQKNRYRDKEVISQLLIDYEQKLGRDIIREDITKEKIGFSSIVINRIWGTLNNCKKELGLKGCFFKKIYKDEELIPCLDIILEKIKKENRKEITIKYDIVNSPYLEGSIYTNRLEKMLKKQGTTLRDYIELKGLSLANNGNGICHKFKDGELTKSSLEYNFTIYLRECLNMKKDVNYKRNVLYKTFSNTDRLIDCDYVIKYKGREIYVEITGMIKPNHKHDWETYDFKSKGKNKYRDNFLLKKTLLEENNKEYYLLFSDDILNKTYEEIFK